METAIDWLKNNHYEDVALVITKIIESWQESGNKTRRNWWDKLCGDRYGKPKSVNGIKIPVLRAAQIRQGVPITKNALCRNENEIPPLKWENTRWKKV